MSASTGRRPLGDIFARELAPEDRLSRDTQPQTPPRDEVDLREPDHPKADPTTGALEVRTASVYIPAPLGEKARATCRSRNMLLTDLVIEAVNSHLPAIRRTLDQNNDTAAAPDDGGMPTRSARAYKKRTRIEGGRSELQLRLDRVQRDWLDRQVATTGALSRSHFITVALQLHLGG